MVRNLLDRTPVGGEIEIVVYMVVVKIMSKM